MVLPEPDAGRAACSLGDRHWNACELQERAQGAHRNQEGEPFPSAMSPHCALLPKCNCHARMLSCFCLFATPWTVACEAFLPVGFSRQKYWSGLPFHSPGDLPGD